MCTILVLITFNYFNELNHISTWYLDICVYIQTAKYLLRLHCIIITVVNIHFKIIM